jgi:hypothetical protein
MSFIQSLDSYELNNLIRAAKERIVLALPGLFAENGTAILAKFGTGFKKIKVIVNCSEKLIRQGYGDIETIQKLKEAGVPVFDQPDNLVSFVICDNKGYFLFPQSRIFLEDSHNVRNAIEMDPFSLEKIIGLFFPPNLFERKEFEDKLNNAVILSSQRVQNIDEILSDASIIQVSPLDDQKFNPVKKAIESNPPVHPDIKRKLEYYTTNFLWVKMEFNGANISSKTINIPPHVLPIDSDELRKKLTANIKLFENIQSCPWYYKLKKINTDEKNLRKKYLHPIREKNGMNIISKLVLEAFITDLKLIQQNILNTKLSIKTTIDEEIENAKSKLKTVLFDFYKLNFQKYFHRYASDHDDPFITSYVDDLIGEIHFFDAEELFSKFSLEYHDFELTYNDLGNTKLLNELREKKILNDKKVNSLDNRGNAFKTL